VTLDIAYMTHAQTQDTDIKHAQAHTQTHEQTYAHAQASFHSLPPPLHTHKHKHTRTHAYLHSLAHISIQTLSCSLSLSYTHTKIYYDTCMSTHTHTHTLIHWRCDWTISGRSDGTVYWRSSRLSRHQLHSAAGAMQIDFLSHSNNSTPAGGVGVCSCDRDAEPTSTKKQEAKGFLTFQDRAPAR